MTEHVVLTLVEVLHFAEIILSINLKRNPLVPIQRTDPYLFVDRYLYMAAFLYGHIEFVNRFVFTWHVINCSESECHRE